MAALTPTVIQPTQVSYVNINQGIAGLAPSLATVLVWDLHGQQSATMQVTFDAVNWTTVNTLVGGGSHSTMIFPNQNIGYRVIVP